MQYFINCHVKLKMLTLSLVQIDIAVYIASCTLCTVYKSVRCMHRRWFCTISCQCRARALVAIACIASVWLPYSRVRVLQVESVWRVHVADYILYVSECMYIYFFWLWSETTFRPCFCVWWSVVAVVVCVKTCHVIITVRSPGGTSLHVRERYMCCVFCCCWLQDIAIQFKVLIGKIGPFKSVKSVIYYCLNYARIVRLYKII